MKFIYVNQPNNLRSIISCWTIDYSLLVITFFRFVASFDADTIINTPAGTAVWLYAVQHGLVAFK